jgi:hypothetical protein
MDGNVSWIQYKGQDILFEDHARDNTVENVRTRALKTKELILTSGKTEILILINLQDIFLVPKVMETFMDVGKAIEPYVKKSALVGGSGGGKPVLIKATQRKLSKMDSRVFESLDEAKEWLVSD